MDLQNGNQPDSGKNDSAQDKTKADKEGDGEQVPASGDPLKDTVANLAAIRQQSEGQVSRSQMLIEHATERIGTPLSLLLLLLFIVIWMGGNFAATRTGRKPLDPPPFYWLQGIVGIIALTTTTMVLISQNRQLKRNERREQFDIQISLLAEQKTAKLIELVEELRRDLPNVPNHSDSEAEAMAESVDPHAAVQELEKAMDSPQDKRG